MKINKHKICQTLTQLTLEVSKIYEPNVQRQCHLVQLFLDTLAVILRKRSKIIIEILPILLKYQEIYKSSLTKIETSYIVALLNITDYRFVDYKSKNTDPILLFLSSNRQFFVSDPKGP